MNFTTPVGRLVYGSVWEGSSTDAKGATRITKSGPNAGQPRVSWDFGVAFPKVLANGQPNEEFNKFYRDVIDACRAGYPQFYTGPVDAFTGKPGCIRPGGMALKVKDGDGVDANGKQNNQKEGWAGHWVVSFSGSFAPRVFDINVGLDPTQQLQDKTRVLPGDFVAVSGTCDANLGAESPGVYMNGNMVCFIGAGPRIVSGPKASDVFGGLKTAALPPGCVMGATPASVAPVTPPNGAIAPAVAPAVGSVPAVPGIAAPAIGIAPAVVHDPMQKAVADGWIVHPSSPTHMYKGQDVKVIAEVLALYPAPVAAPTLPAAPAAPGVPPAPIVPNPGFVAAAAGVPPAPVVPAITLTPAAIAAGYTLASFEQAGFTYDMMKQGRWTL